MPDPAREQLVLDDLGNGTDRPRRKHVGDGYLAPA